MLGFIACNTCEDLPDEQAMQCLASLPVRNLSSQLSTKNYLNQHKVYVSLTTSPERLSKLEPTLSSLDLQHVEKIFLALPKLYRNETAYDLSLVEPLKEKFPKLRVIAQEYDHDYGPVMKMLPAIELVGKTDPNALVISVDDDMAYSKGMVNEFIYHAVGYPDAVLSGWGNYIEVYGILEEEWPAVGKARKKPLCGSGPISFCDTVEGWRGVAYRPRLVSTGRLKQLSRLSKACRTSDDLVISYVIAEGGVDMVRVINEYSRDIHRFSSNSDAGALHKIKLNIPGWSPRPSVDATFSGTTNSERYQRCVLDILENDRE